MERGQILTVAEQLLDAHRESLFIDPFYTIKLELVEGDFICDIIDDDKAALSWILKINPTRHNEIYDIHYSVIECLIQIICAPLSGQGRDKDGVIARLTKSFADLSISQFDGGEGGEHED